MRSRTLTLLCVAVVVGLAAHAAFAVMLARTLLGPGQRNNGPAVAQGQAFEMQDAVLAPVNAAAQPCSKEDLKQVRGPAVATGAFELTGPYTHANLSVFFIHGPNMMGEQKIITLEDALNQNLAVVYDGGFGLSVDNRSTLPLFIQGGDIVKGGNQDRVLPNDYLIPAGATRAPVAAFCVEAGRSFPRGQELSSSFQVSSEQLPTKDLKLAALYRKSQTGVWSGISQTQANLSRNVGGPVQARQSQTSLQLTLEHPLVNQAADAYVRELLPRADKDNVIGFAVAINGTIHSADVYASSDLFRQLWPKLARASAVAALAERPAGANASAPTTEAVQAFLAEPEKGQATRQTIAGQVHLVRHETDRNLLYETCDGGQGNLVVHRCYLAK